MHVSISLVLFSLAVSVPASAQHADVGASEDAVLEAHGAPDREVRAGQTGAHIWFYEADALGDTRSFRIRDGIVRAVSVTARYLDEAAARARITSRTDALAEQGVVMTPRDDDGVTTVFGVGNEVAILIRFVPRLGADGRPVYELTERVHTLEDLLEPSDEPRR